MNDLNYTPTEKIKVKRPVNRIKYISEACTGKVVLDLGCFDETALNKKNSGTWLFEEISKVSKNHIGIDSSELISVEGIDYSENNKILKGDILNYDYTILINENFDVIIAGELIEHLPNTLEFFSHIKKYFPGKRLICTTPNATSISNVVLASARRESTHHDHKQIYSFKTLNTLCKLSEFKTWEIRPYYVKYTEMILNSGFPKKQIAQFAQGTINLHEFIFPLFCGGLVLDIEI
jgi:SAM-dependent methyltransferase